MKTKQLIFYIIFFLLFFMQSGIIYLLFYLPDIIIWIQSFLASSLIMCFSFGFILISMGLKEEINDDKNVLLRGMGYILILITFGSLLLIMNEIKKG